MILKNFMHIICSNINGKNKFVVKNVKGMSLTIDSDGSDNFGTYVLQDVFALNPNYTTDLSGIGGTGGCLYVGSGTSSVTQNDYKLESIIPVSKLKIINEIIQRQKDYDSLVTMYLTVKNITEENVSVSEIGYFYSKCMSNNPYSADQVMMIRQVFDTITIKPGEVYTFTLNIE